MLTKPLIIHVNMQDGTELLVAELDVEAVEREAAEQRAALCAEHEQRLTHQAKVWSCLAHKVATLEILLGAARCFLISALQVFDLTRLDWKCRAWNC